MKPCILFLILLTLRCLPLLGQTGYTQEGNASYYADKFHGRTTASGERYDTGKNTCAHMVLPYGTMLKVTNLGNGKSTIVRVNDRGPFAPNRIIDLSRKAAEEIDLVRTGVAKVRIETVAATAEPQPAAQTTAEAPTTSTPEKEPTPAREATPEPPASTSTPAAAVNGALKGTLADGKEFFLRIVTPQGGQYGVQVASYKDVSNLLGTIAGWDYPTRAKVVLLDSQKDDKPTYRVVLGTFSTRDEAEKYQKEIASRFPGCFIVGL